MKLFLRRIGLFLFILFCFSATVLAVLDYLNNRAFRNYKMNPDVTTVFMGDSHIQCAVNDALLTKSRNFAQSAEASYYTYHKMKVLLETNPGIKKVYLGLGYHNISNHYDGYIFGKHAKDIAARYFLILPLKDQLMIISRNPGDFIELMGNVWNNGIKNIHLEKADNTLLGHYENYWSNVAAKKSAIDKRVLLQFYENGRLRDFSKFNIRYIQKMIELCRSANIELVIVNAPVHPYYKAKVPPVFKDKYGRLIGENKLEVFSFDALKLNDGSYVPDGDHISAEGSVFTTALFKE
jgi:hypothetical protein